MRAITVARKPISESNVASNVLKWGTGALNIKASRIGTEVVKTHGKGSMSGAAPIVPQDQDFEGGTHIGRWPGNLVLEHLQECHLVDTDEWDCVLECPVAALDVMSGPCTTGRLEPHHHLKASENVCMSGPNQDRHPRRTMGGDTGGAARFFKQVQREDS